MTALLLVLMPIALLDSVSILPLCIVAQAILLAGRRPILTCAAFILGIFTIYLVTGLLLLISLDAVFGEVNDFAIKMFDDPSTEEVLFQIALGLGLCLFGLRLSKARRPKKSLSSLMNISPAKAFFVGIGLTFFGMPGGFAYFAAVDLILRAEVARSQEIIAVLFYSIVFVCPFVAIIVGRLILGDRGDEVLTRVKVFVERFGPMAIVLLFMALGVVLVGDGVSWLFGAPLIPL
ncbi:MAG: GAP family protein [Pseudomonadota bacterium]